MADPRQSGRMIPATVASFSASALVWLDIAGLAVFAASGALAAAKARQTAVTFVFFALITGVGGGTIRDLLIGAPVFWMHTSRAMIACIAMAALVWITPARWWRGRALDWLDAVGLAAYASYGAAKALAWGIPPIPAFGMGVVTACAGGVLRDVIAGVPSILMRPELYVTAAALSSACLVLLDRSGMALLPAALIASVGGFSLRALAIGRGLALPVYRRG